MVSAAEKPGISGGYFSSEKLQKHFSSTVLGVFRQQKRKPEIFGLPIHIFFEYLDCFLLKGDFLRTTVASAQKLVQQFCFIKALIPPVHCSSSSHEYPGCSYRRISRISSGRPHAPPLRPRRSGGGYCSYSPGENG